MSTPSTKPTQLSLSLSTLLPTHPFPLPEPLLNLATSLLAQSRQRAPRLKTEEEVARTFACAHIACERLRNRLNLDLVSENKVKPPAPPRVYRKLKGYLDGVLGSSKASTGVTNVQDFRSGVSAPTTPSGRSATANNTPNKNAETPTRTPTSTLGKRVREPESQANLDFAMPMIRHLCKTCGLPGAAPHVFVGTSTVANEIGSRSLGGGSAAKRRRRTPQRGKDSPAVVEAQTLPATGVSLTKWPALLTTMYLISASKMLGVELDDDKVQQWRAKAVDTVAKYLEGNAAKLPAGLDAEVAQLDTAVGFYLLEAEDSGWLNMEWYQNVPATSNLLDEDDESGDDDEGDEGGALDGEPTDAGGRDASLGRRKHPAKTPLRRSEKHGAANRRFLDDGREDPGAAGLLPGLATMFQPAVDWLSDERRADFATWKEALLRELRVLEQSA